jgi:hypothetical protein
MPPAWAAQNSVEEALRNHYEWVQITAMKP